MGVSQRAVLPHWLTKRFVVIATFCFIPVMQVEAETTVSGIINNDQTWLKSNSPFVITDNTTVAVQVTLSVEAGVEVRFTGPYWLKVEGTLLAQGSDEESIVFTGDDPSTYWHRLEFLPGSDASRLDHVEISNAGGASTNGSQAYGALYLAGSSPQLSDLHIHDNHVTGLFAENIATDLTLSNSDISDNINTTITGIGAGGVFIEGIGTANLTIQNNRIMENHTNSHGGGMYISGAQSVTVIDNQIFNNQATSDFGFGGGLYIANLNGDTTQNVIANNNIANNIADKDGGGIWIDESAVSIRDNTLQANQALDSQGGALYLGDSNSLDLIQSSSSIHHNLIYDNHSLELGGAVYMENGTHTVANNVFYGNTADDTSGLITNEQGGALMLRDGAINFNNNVVADNAAANGGAINVSGTGNLSNNSFSHNFSRHILRLAGSITVHGNTFAANVSELTTLFVPPQQSPIPVVNNNNFFTANADEQNAYVVDNLNMTLLNAQSNWWGTADAQEISTLVSDTIDVSGYSPEPLTDTPVAPPRIIAVSFTVDTAELAWEDRGEPDVTGFKIYWGENPAPAWGNVMDAGTDTHIIITQLEPNKAYYFAVTAYDGESGNDSLQTAINEDQLSGHESWYSLSVYKPVVAAQNDTGGGALSLILGCICTIAAIGRLREKQINA